MSIEHQKKKNDGMTVPESYFEKFESKMLSKVRAEEAAAKTQEDASIQHEPTVIPLVLRTQFIRISIAMAACLILALLIFNPQRGMEEYETESLIALASMPAANLEYYIENYLEITEEELIEELAFAGYSGEELMLDEDELSTEVLLEYIELENLNEMN